MSKSLYLAIAGAALFLASCSTIVPYTATNNPIGDSIGKSRTTLIFGKKVDSGSLEAGISTNKNFGVIEAAKKGNIERIATVDVKTTNFIVFQKVEIIVTGE
ncbi:MAG: hypothetical protein HWE22_12455 [Flavobacteriales bacterium]|nr:hypothetical protein [Flavobacteriales bacterium]